MTHDHRGHAREGAILHDGCPECDRRAAEPLDGLLHLDGETFERMYARMRAVEYSRDPDGAALAPHLIGDGTSYGSRNDAKMGKALYRISVLLERRGSVLVRR